MQLVQSGLDEPGAKTVLEPSNGSIRVVSGIRPRGLDFGSILTLCFLAYLAGALVQLVGGASLHAKLSWSSGAQSILFSALGLAIAIACVGLLRTYKGGRQYIALRSALNQLGCIDVESHPPTDGPPSLRAALWTSLLSTLGLKDHELGEIVAKYRTLTDSPLLRGAWDARDARDFLRRLDQQPTVLGLPAESDRFEESSLTRLGFAGITQWQSIFEFAVGAGFLCASVFSFMLPGLAAGVGVFAWLGFWLLLRAARRTGFLPWDISYALASPDRITIVRAWRERVFERGSTVVVIGRATRIGVHVELVNSLGEVASLMLDWWAMRRLMDAWSTSPSMPASEPA